MESDLVSLSPDFLVADGLHLIDSELGAHHQLSELALHPLDLLKKPIPFGKWRTESMLEPSHQSELIAFLNHIGAIRLNRNFNGHKKWLMQIILTLMHGYLPSPLTYRRQASIAAIGVALSRCSLWLVFAWLASLGVIFGSGVFSTEVFIISSLTCLAIMLITSFAHEIAHTHVIRRGGKVPVIFQAGLRVGLIHAKLSPNQEIASAIFGPCIGAILAVTLGFIAAWILQINELVFCGYLLAIFHLISLLPWYGDGSSIVKSTKQWIRI